MQRLLVSCFISGLFLFVSMNVFAQESSELSSERLKIETAEKESPAMKGVTLNKKIMGRLPNGYREIVTDAQKEEIHKVQKEYAFVIEHLKLRVELLEAERDKKIRALLNEEQSLKIGQMEAAKKSPSSDMKKPRTYKSKEKSIGDLPPVQ